MLKNIVAFLKPPKFPDNESKTRRTKVLYFQVSVLLIIMLIVGLIGIPFIFIKKGIASILLLSIAVSLIFVNLAAKKGYLKTGGFLLIFILWLYTIVIFYIGNGTSSAHLTLLTALTIMAGIILSFRWAVVTIILNSIILLVFAVLETNNYSFPDLLPEPPIVRWFIFTLIHVLVIAPVYTMLSSMYEALNKAKGENDYRKRTEKLLLESEKKFRDIANNIPGLVFQFSVKKLVIQDFSFLSSQGMELLGFELKDNVVKWNFLDLIHNEDKDLFLSSVTESVEKGGNWFFEGRLLNSNNEVIWTQGFASPFQKGDEVIFNGVLLDISKRKDLENQILQTQKMDALGKVAGGMAHDFNNMLTPILGFVELGMEELPKDSEIFLNLEEVRKAAQRASKLTQQILAFSRQQLLSLNVISINFLIHDLENILKKIVGENIIIEKRLSDNLFDVKADKNQLEHVIVNIVVNAHDAMEGKGRLIFETSNVYLDKDFKVSAEGNYSKKFVSISISDSGVGINQSNIKKIFDPFFTTKEHGKGTGLGLSTAFGIIKQHLGSIQVYSEEGNGSTFKIFLPAAGNFVNEQPSIYRVHKQLDGTETVLTVDDEPMIVDYLEKVLIAHGYNVIKAGSAKEALNIIAENKIKIDLILTDMVMPEVSGHELYIKVKESFPEIKVVFMSGYINEESFQDIAFQNDISLLKKPFSSEQLLKHLRDELD